MRGADLYREPLRFAGAARFHATLDGDGSRHPILAIGGGGGRRRGGEDQQDQAQAEQQPVPIRAAL